MKVGDRVELYSLEERDFFAEEMNHLSYLPSVRQRYREASELKYIITEISVNFTISMRCLVETPVVYLRAIGHSNLQIQAQLDYLKLLNEV